MSGRHDLERAADLCGHFSIPAAVVINKADLNPDACGDIRAFCRLRELAMVGEIPHDDRFVTAMIREKAVTELSDSAAADCIRRIWSGIEADALSGVPKRTETISIKEEE